MTKLPVDMTDQTAILALGLKERISAGDTRGMKAIFLESQGGADSLVTGEIPRPNPGEGEVLVKVHATAVTPTEFQWYPTFNTQAGTPRPFPIVLSHEFSGVVEAVGGNAGDFTVGEQVYGLNDWFTNGAQADYCVARASALARKPKSLNYVEAAVVPISALTAWQALFEKSKLERHQRILIHGAAGGVGIFAVQLARWRGARVIATASSPDLDFVRALGADEVIDYRKTRFEDVICDVDVVFDTVGGETLERSWGVLKPGGRLVTVATLREGEIEQRVRNAFMLVRADGSQLAQISWMFDAGELRGFVGEVLPLAGAREAYACARRDGIHGKIALRVVEY